MLVSKENLNVLLSSIISLVSFSCLVVKKAGYDYGLAYSLKRLICYRNS